MTTHELAQVLGISTTTIRRWLKERRVPEPQRSPAGWRDFAEADLARFSQVLRKLHGVQTGSRP